MDQDDPVSSLCLWAGEGPGNLQDLDDIRQLHHQEVPPAWMTTQECWRSGAPCPTWRKLHHLFLALQLTLTVKLLLICVADCSTKVSSPCNWYYMYNLKDGFHHIPNFWVQLVSIIFWVLYTPPTQKECVKTGLIATPHLPKCIFLVFLLGE